MSSKQCDSMLSKCLEALKNQNKKSVVCDTIKEFPRDELLSFMDSMKGDGKSSTDLSSFLETVKIQ